MFRAKCHLKSSRPISFSKVINSQKGDNETHDEFESRTWKERTHINENGNVCIPGMMFKKSLDSAAKWLGKIPGKGNSTYTKLFVGGVLPRNDIDLKVKPENVDGEWIFGAADGKPGGSTRVRKCFPKVDEWEGNIEFAVTADDIDKKAFERALKIAGLNVGIGRFRASNGGDKGMFSVEDIEYEDFEF